MNWTALIGAVLLCFVVVERMFFLAPIPCGWIMYLSNVLSETATRKAGVPRTVVDLSCSCVGLGFLWLGNVPVEGILLAGMCLLGLELSVRLYERSILTATYTRLDRTGLHAKESSQSPHEQGYPAPSAHPELTINLIGPFVARVPRYQLGTLLVGREFEIRMVIGNHTIVPTQTAICVRAEFPNSLVCTRAPGNTAPRLRSGEVHELQWRWRVDAAADSGRIQFDVGWGNLRRRMNVGFERCVSGEGHGIARATISRYPGACRSAFAWRGDMDLYDEATMQSIEGLEVTFGLAARYRMPQTLFLSSRLALDESAAKEWAAHYGVDRGADRIPAFVEWIRRDVDLRHICSYPFPATKRFVVELGNHGHLHFGTDTSAAPENGWKPRARMGEGVYHWLGEDRSSFGEQRDNAVEARRWFERLFGFSPKSWAMPDRTNDRSTAMAMEAAGCEVLSGSDIKARHNVLLQPPPHHPDGTSAVELTIRHPGDPRHINQVAMFLFWLHRAHRKCVPAVFMCHQHMHQFSSHACVRMTEYVLRYALSHFNGDFHVNTVYGIGKYWREVLSAQTRSIHASSSPTTVQLKNGSDLHILDLPLDVTLFEGHRYTELVDLAPGQVIDLPLGLRATSDPLVLRGSQAGSA